MSQSRSTSATPGSATAGCQRPREESTEIQHIQQQRQQFHRSENNRTAASSVLSSSSSTSTSASAAAASITESIRTQPLSLYNDIIHSIIPFLSFRDLSSAHRLNHQWKTAVEAFKVTCGSKLKREHSNWSLDIFREKMLEIRKHPTSPLMRHITKLAIYSDRGAAADLPDLFPSLTVLEIHSSIDGEVFRSINECKNLTDLTFEFDSDNRGDANAADDFDEEGAENDDAVASPLADAINRHKSLTSLRILRRGLNTTRFMSMVNLFRTTPTTSLSLQGEGYDLPLVAVSRLATAIKHSKTLTSLDLDYMVLNAEKIALLADAIKDVENLTTLKVVFTNIRDDCASSLIRIIKQNKKLTHLDISGSEFSDKAAASLADALLHSQSLTFVDLTCSSYKAAGAAVFADCVNNNKRLTIDLRENDITNEEALSIAAKVNGASVSIPISLFGGSYDSSIRLYLPGDPDPAILEKEQRQMERASNSMKALMNALDNARPEDRVNVIHDAIDSNRRDQ